LDQSKLAVAVDIVAAEAMFPDHRPTRQAAAIIPVLFIFLMIFSPFER